MVEGRFYCLRCTIVWHNVLTDHDKNSCQEDFYTYLWKIEGIDKKDIREFNHRSGLPNCTKCGHTKFKALGNQLIVIEI